MTAVHQVCLLLGSNIQPEKNLRQAMDLLRRHVGVVCNSSVWDTLAVGLDGPNFLNMAVLIVTRLDAVDLKVKILRPLEQQLGRVRGEDKNASRTIDVDIVIFDDTLLDPNLWQFAHRAVPVAELLPGFRSGQGKPLKMVADELAKTTPVRRLGNLMASPNIRVT